jgi:hypothetical protein
MSNHEGMRKPSQGISAPRIRAWFLIRHSCFVLSVAIPLSIFAAQDRPSAQEILASVRMRQAQQRIDLQGQLRQDAKIVPFRLTQTGPIVRYSFSNPDEVLELRLGENDSRLDIVTDTDTQKLAASKLGEEVRGTGISYEDLSLRFLYWPKASVVGEQELRTRPCWKLQLLAPSHDSQYGTIWLWVDKDSGALMRMEGYDWKGQLLKRFEVVSAQKIDNRWFLKQMRIEQFDPETKKVQSRTYLEIKK